MNHFLHGVARALTETFALPGPVLEIGAYQVGGQEAIADLRPFFPGQRYLGLDCRPGPGVDVIADVESLPCASGSAGTVIAMNTFEHVRHFWRGFEEIYRVLRPDGALLVSCPFHFKIHNYPADYWRFTPGALELMLADYPSKILGWHGPRNRPAHVWALAFREDHAPITAEQFDGYRRLLARYARQPCSPGRTLRYRLGSLLCGRGPFASYLDRERWETVCRTSPAPARKPLRRSPGSGGPLTSLCASSTGTAESCSVAVSSH